VLRYEGANLGYQIFACSCPIIRELILTYCYRRIATPAPPPDIFSKAEDLVFWAVKQIDCDILRNPITWNTTTKYPSEIIFQSELYAIIRSVLRYPQFAQWRVVCEPKCGRVNRGDLYVWDGQKFLYEFKACPKALSSGELLSVTDLLF
jgi:hypothetical protein